MLGLMQDWPLLCQRVIEHAAREHGGRRVASRRADGSLRETSYAEIHQRATQVSRQMLAEGSTPGDRIGTVAYSTSSHMECWYGIAGIGAVYHPINPRLFAEQIVFIINHASDRWLLADPQFAPLIEKLRPRCPTLERIIYLCGPDQLPAGAGVADYESLIDGRPTDVPWGTVDEHAPAALCYTSGTTGNPKGVLYSHRSQVLHAMICVMICQNRSGAAACYPRFMLEIGDIAPDIQLEPGSLYELLETEAVTLSAAVPTVWQALLDFLTTNRLPLSTLRRVIIGGSAVTEALIRGFRDGYGVEVLHAWGMTEMSPIGTISGAPPPAVAALGADARVAFNLKQGRAPFGIDMKITDDDEVRLPQDGVAQGHVRVQGPAIIARYFREPGEVLDAEGYFDTGDIATIDPHGYMQITDRATDVIKSGGEWISSVEIENIAASHPKALMAAVIGVPDPRWRERPLLIVRLRPGQEATAAEFLAWLDGKIAKWWMPDSVLFVDEMPLGATGKLDKKVLRARYAQAATPSE
ncbi:MAG: AMP-binding protein [Proteobacteria bacterium]|nr:AMP-binding protein [Pseudomonadota bacterium]